MALLAALPLVSCRPVERPGAAAAPLFVFAAASTAGPLEEIATAFRAETGVEVLTSVASSSTLAQQIMQGAEADLFLSASRDWAARLEEKQLVAASRDLLSNRLVVIVLPGASGNLTAPRDLLDPQIQHVAIADPASVPAGIYARQALEKLGLWERLAPKLVAAEDVRQALAFVETGAAEAGIVYATDATASRHVAVAMEIDRALTEPIVYPLVLLQSAAAKADARRLFDYLASDAAAAVFRRHGFTVLSMPGPGP
jgi:molybdate transport system substrate-binding protein